MGQIKDFTGLRFGKLVVIEVLPAQDPSKGRMVRCACDCGKETVVPRKAVQSGNTSSCGCGKKRQKTRMDRGTKAYRIWQAMLNRCRNPKVKGYQYYGGRGIKVCERWKSFDNFIADMGQPDENQSIDRIDPNGDYEPTNCRWATQKEQVNNTARNRLIERDGEKMTASQWANRLGINAHLFCTRLRNGWSFERASSEPVKTKEKRAKQKGVSWSSTYQKWCVLIYRSKDRTDYVGRYDTLEEAVAKRDEYLKDNGLTDWLEKQWAKTKSNRSNREVAT